MDLQSIKLAPTVMVFPKMDLENWFFRIPPITRSYITLLISTTLATHLKFVTKFDLFFNWSLIYQQHQYWRLITTFLYFGQFSLDFVFQIHFVLMYCQQLEQDCYRGRRSDFAYFLFLSAIGIIVITIDRFWRLL